MQRATQKREHSNHIDNRTMAMGRRSINSMKIFMHRRRGPMSIFAHKIMETTLSRMANTASMSQSPKPKNQNEQFLVSSAVRTFAATFRYCFMARHTFIYVLAAVLYWPQSRISVDRIENIKCVPKTSLCGMRSLHVVRARDVSQLNGLWTMWCGALRSNAMHSCAARKSK